MSNPNRDYDKTHLSIDLAEDRVLIHRDYIAHCMRWSHVIKYLYSSHRYKTAKILDIGCGKEIPLAKALYSNRMSGAQYCGVDLNEVIIPEMLKTAIANGKIDVWTMGKTNAAHLNMADLPFRPNVITSFEVFEHMNPTAARAYLEVCYELLDRDGIMFFSTPCWNGKAAGNHINEPTYQAMGWILEDVGFNITNHFGTFASITDYKGFVQDDGFTTMFNRLREYYDTNMLAILLAPLYPQGSRNCLWSLTKDRQIKRFDKPQTRYSQHKDWEMLNG